MKKIINSIFCLFAVFALLHSSRAQMMIEIENSEDLNEIISKSVAGILEKNKTQNIGDDEIAVTLIDLRENRKIKKGSFNGDLKIYPASVVKVFYLVAAHRWLEDGQIKTSPELTRGLRDMIVDSSNDATHYIVDVLTDTSGGAEISGEEFETYAYKRNAVNRYFQKLGFENINVNQKTYCEDLYGRERQFWNNGKNRNMLTTDATARLLTGIVLHKAVSYQRSGQMLELLKRNPADERGAVSAENPADIITVVKNIKGVKIRSKSGLTGATHHDAAYVETPDGQKFVLVIFTQNHAKKLQLLPAIAETIILKLRKK